MNRPLFRGYATRDLDAAAQAFYKRTNKDPEVFLIQNGYIVQGSRHNHEKILESRYGAFMAILIPLILTRNDLIALEHERTQAQQREGIEQREGEVSQHLHTQRYCYYCGQVIDVGLMSNINHCNKLSCIERHEERAAIKRETQAAYNHAQPNRLPDTITKVPPRKEPPPQKVIRQIIDDDFSLDDPYVDSLKGYVYLIESDNGLYKIGRSDDVWSRFRSLSTENAAALTLRHAIKANDYIRAEAWMHANFAYTRHHGEWFRLTQDDVLWFCGLVDGALDGSALTIKSL